MSRRRNRLQEAVENISSGDYSLPQIQNALSHDLGRPVSLQELLAVFNRNPNFRNQAGPQLTPRTRITVNDLRMSFNSDEPPFITAYESVEVVPAVSNIRPRLPVFSAEPTDETICARPSDTQERRYLLFWEAASLLQSGKIVGSMIDPENQLEVPPGNVRVTLIRIDGFEYDVIARYDSRTNQMFPSTYSQ